MPTFTIDTDKAQDLDRIYAAIQDAAAFLDDKQKELLHEQRKAMLDYKDVLFRRCCLNEVDLYKHTFNCKPAPEGKL